MTSKKLQKIGNIIFWLTLISLPFSFTLTTIVGEANIFGLARFIRYLWIMYLFIPIGILSIVFGIKLKRNNLKYKKNFVAAFICIPMLVICGSGKQTFADSFQYDSKRVQTIGKKISIEFPNEISEATIKSDEYDLTYAKIISNDSKIKFEYTIQTNGLWKNDLDIRIKGLLPIIEQGEIQDFDYYVFYNETTNEYNTYPSVENYQCIFVSYALKNQRLMLIDNYKVSVN